MSEVRNTWYMAGWDRDFPAAVPQARTILGEALVFFRNGAGEVVAMEDRCPHRLAPLSLGKCEGSNLRCMYHGLLFGPDGRCIEIPGQGTIPPQARVRAFPVVERHSAIWIWLGELPADEALIPPFVGYHDPAWAMEPGMIDYAAPARLVNHNLLDLSHVAFVHLDSFSGGNSASAKGWADADVHYETLPRGVRVSRWMKNMPKGPISAGALADSRGAGIDAWTSYDFLVPGIFLQVTERYEPGSYQVGPDGRPIGEALLKTFSCQAVTPVTADTARYFFAYGPSSQHGERKQFFTDLSRKAFEEDRVIIEAQQQVISRSSNPRVLPLAMDRALLLYEGVLKRLSRSEGETAHPRLEVVAE